MNGLQRMFGFRSSKRWVSEGRDASRRRDWTAAASAYREALSINPKLWKIWVQYGHAMKESGHLKEAEDAYRRSLQLSPGISDTHLQLGHVLKLKKDATAASSAYLQAAVLDPDNLHAFTELGALGWTKEEVIEIVDPQGRQRTKASIPAGRSEITRIATAGSPSFDAQAYVGRFADVRTLLDLGLISSAEQHYLHYGYRGGRDILATFADKPPTRVFVLCPSFFKRCGIGEHARYLADSIETFGLETHRVRTTAVLETYPPEQLRDAVVIVNHGPGLFDGYNPELSEGEATTDLITKLLALHRAHGLRPVVFMHSLLDRDNVIMFPRQQFWLESPIPVVTTIEAAGNVFNILRVEHGMQPAPTPVRSEKALNRRDRPVIGFFGFFQWGGKNFDALLDVVQRLKGKLVGSVATGSEYDVEKLRGLIADRNIQCNLGTGWVEDSELMQRLAEADYYYLPQHDYDHWNNSGTARLVMNFHQPVILPPHNPFLDLREFAIFADEHDLPGLMAWMRDEKVYQSACARAARYAAEHPMTVEMPKLAMSLHEVASETGARNFIDESAFSTWSLLAIPFEQFLARVRRRLPENALYYLEKTQPDSADRAAQIKTLKLDNPGKFETTYSAPLGIQYWKDHYEIDSFFFPRMTECFVNAYRCFLKREPSMTDRDKMIRILGVDLRDETAIAWPAKVVAMLALLHDEAPALEFAAQAQIYDQGELLTKTELASTALIETLEQRWVKRLKLCQDTATVGQPAFGTAQDRNIVQLLLLPGPWLEAALHASARAAGLDLNFDGIGARIGPLSRYQGIIQILERANVRLTEIGLFDRPIVSAINHARAQYSLADFWPLEGDAFVFHVVRCLLKRDPLTQEMFGLGELLSKQGKLAVIRQVAGRPFVATSVVDIADDQAAAELDTLLPNLELLVSQFRAVYAGGWDLRNAYLEARRNFDRVWLRMKKQKDVWWAQANGDVSRILPAKHAAGAKQGS
ncbi:hypothetical protein ACETRX_30910 [Labrys portucalensis]|uniref:Tetratricopeptide repeat-containing glycosyltransferase family protein n=1 Tax=Labrys neptuniae TaxID=376174 RepID=A0ABV6ZPI5_9HYPH